MRQFILPILLIVVTSCKDVNIAIDAAAVRETTLTPIEIQDLTIDEEIESWTSKMRTKTIKEVNSLQFDSIVADTTEFYITEFYYFRGLKVKAICFTRDYYDTVGFYYKSPATELDANGETCPRINTDLIESGSLHTYRGLKYIDKHIGIATYLQCDQSTFEKGIYYNDQRIGIWKTLDLKTNKVSTKDFGNEELIKRIKAAINGCIKCGLNT